MEEVQYGLVAALILLDHLWVLEIRSCGHPAVNLGRESLDMVGDLQVSLEGIDIGSWLILGGQTGEGNIDGLGIIGIDHSWVALSSGLEDLVVGSSGESSDLTAPAEA